MADNDNDNLPGDNDGEDGTMSRGTVDSTSRGNAADWGGSACASRDQESKTYPYRLGHLSNPQSNRTELLGVNDDAENSKSSV